MNIRKVKKEELEAMSYNDIAYYLVESEKEKSTKDLFNEIIDLLELPKSTFEQKIGQFYTSLTNDKRFILLEDGNWDLRINHKVSKLIEHTEEDYEEVEEYDDEPEIDVEEEKEDLYSEENDDTTSLAEEYKNLVIIDEEELSEE